ncbi:hypothetical protein [Flavobacterium algicola]|uniref:hypothetical protein n=1 Tax=Flavobacterium algicola TaxID=556529 RepID=UPI001EFD7CC0|nr:hypothetical protein [Flavobacterium algicola]MCG9792391.1 hypothetical protein [Flavobacterium algicola]
MNYRTVFLQNKKVVLTALIVLAFSCKKETIGINKINKNDTIVMVEPKEEKVIPTETESAFLKVLIKREIGDQKYKEMQVQELPFYVSFANDGDPYTVSYLISHKGDLNNDGIIDYVINRSSEGMLGGNSNTNQDFIFYIMKDEINEKESHSILGYAPFSYNIIDDSKFVNNTLLVDISQNYRTYSTNDTKSTSLSFVYRNGNLYEESYLSDCKLSQLKSKTIFINIAEVHKRTRSIDMHNYTETIDEEYKNNDTIVTANLSGCDNLLLSFESTYKVPSDKINDATFKRATTLQFLNFLSRNTQFSKEINIVSKYFNHNVINDEYIEAIKGYKFRILIQKNDEDKNELRFLVQIDRIDNPYQIENWEITTRQKKNSN